MIVKGRTTRQGLRDLNYYGPRRAKPGDPPAAEVVAAAPAAAEIGPEAAPPVPPAVEAPDEGVSK
jgi:hypothetical protein